MDETATEPLFNRLVHFVEQGFRAGDKLPGERDLAEMFGVSRNQLREELSRLEAYRLVELRPKARAIVTREAASLERLAHFSRVGVPVGTRQAQQAIEVRRINEVAAVRLACERATPSNLAAIAAIVAQSEKKLKAGKSIHAEDEAFHLELIRATQNDILLATLASFYVMTRPRRQIYFRSKERSVRSHHDHVELFQCIEARDAERAAALLEGHIEKAGNYWSRTGR